MATGFLSLALSEESTRYMQRICSGAPMEFNLNPPVYLSDPRLPLQYEDVQDVLSGVSTAIKFRGAHTLHSPASGLAEFCMLFEPDATLAHYFPEAVGEFRPYFVWAVHVNRSRSTRSFAISTVNTMMADKANLTGLIQWEPSDGLVAQMFNPFTQDPNLV